LYPTLPNTLLNLTSPQTFFPAKQNSNHAGTEQGQGCRDELWPRGARKDASRGAAPHVNALSVLCLSDTCARCSTHPHTAQHAGSAHHSNLSSVSTHSSQPGEVINERPVAVGVAEVRHTLLPLA
jgi:hypothetical protein